MSRMFWFGVGIAAGVALSRRATAAARQATPAGVAANLGEAISELASAVGAFGAEVRAGMNERERELADVVERRTGLPTARRVDFEYSARTERFRPVAGELAPADAARPVRARSVDRSGRGRARRAES
ncbi:MULTISPECIES: hypothetical protein [Actinoalloteichus]|uniref:Secreted protein n=1 Tax=Actinoalloteichus caeruleus DSM 43889 TaxID=1120930 RepID=A0ABT1JH16_ACTCY|nr:hypothetical protein [Actinoalloteichus caeruleus]MCP2331468.1 hypothetical protein [Actinoalloteichus caeruleus DSM 43889]